MRLHINQTLFLPPWKISRSAANTPTTPTYNFRYILPEFFCSTYAKTAKFYHQKFQADPSVQNEVAQNISFMGICRLKVGKNVHSPTDRQVHRIYSAVVCDVLSQKATHLNHSE